MKSSGDERRVGRRHWARALAWLPLAACAASDVSREDVLDEVWATVDERFFDPRCRGVDWPAARERALAAVRASRSSAEFARAVNAMLAELATSHTAFFTRDDASFYVLLELFWEALDPERRAAFHPRGAPAPSGIGILVERDGGAYSVRGVLEGGPAAAAGVLAGDRLLAVDGAAFAPVASFRGRAGRPTTLTLQRAPEGPLLELVVEPEELLPSALFRRALERSARLETRGERRLGYAHVWSYAGEEMQATLSELLLAGPLAEADGLVLDLRGGYGGANPEYLDLFRRDVPELTLVGRDGVEHALSRTWRKPVVLLIDEGTTSGKELFAHGFRRQGRGKIVGARSAGAVVGGSAFLTADGSLLYLAVSDVRVDGERLEGLGVAPDVEVPFPRAFSAGADPQLERAFEELERELGG